MNRKQLSDTLTTLRQAYQEVRERAQKAYHIIKIKRGDFDPMILGTLTDLFYLSPNEAEFLAYDLIIKLEHASLYPEILQ
jgi:hypothetical protein